MGLPFGRFLSVLSQIMWPVSRRQAQCMHMHNMGGDGCLTDAYGAQQESKQAKNTEHSKEQQHIAKHSKQSTANTIWVFFQLFKGIPLDLGLFSTFKGYTLRNWILFGILKGIPFKSGKNKSKGIPFKS